MIVRILWGEEKEREYVKKENRRVVEGIMEGILEAERNTKLEKIMNARKKTSV